MSISQQLLIEYTLKNRTYILDVEGVVLWVAEGGFQAAHSKVFLSVVLEAHQEADGLARWKV